MPSRNTIKQVQIGSEYKSDGTSPVTKHYAIVHQESSQLFGGGRYGYPHFPPHKNVGGAFEHFGDITTRTGGSTKINRGSWSGWYYSGQIVGNLVNIPPLPPIPTGNGSGFGVDAFHKMKPTQPNFNAVTSVLELRELPGLLKANLQQNFLKFQGNYFLAIKFGWEPLLRDIVGLVQTQMDAQKRLAQLIRDNGKSIRRTRSMLENSETTYEASGTSYGALSPTFVTQFYRKPPSYANRIRRFDNVWASARFRYWLPPGPRDIIWTRRMKARIFGLYPSPAQIYNAVPWTWMIDWFSGLGNALENMDAGVADRLAADYFYIMRHQEVVISTTSKGYFYASERNEPVEVDGYAERRRFRKNRVGGDPFGWGTKEIDLNGTQLAILGALGLSKLG